MKSSISEDRNVSLLSPTTLRVSNYRSGNVSRTKEARIESGENEIEESEWPRTIHAPATKTILCISPRLNLTLDKRPILVHGLVQEDWIALNPGDLGIEGSPPLPFWTQWRSDWRVYKIVYLVTYLVLDCQPGSFRHSMNMYDPVPSLIHYWPSVSEFSSLAILGAISDLSKSGKTEGSWSFSIGKSWRHAFPFVEDFRGYILYELFCFWRISRDRGDFWLLLLCNIYLYNFVQSLGTLYCF